MSNGCICCTLREDLLLEVRRLAAEGRFDYLLIESTGIGEPMPVAATFDFEDDNGDSLNDVARIDTMVTVVDAFNLLADFSSTDLLAQRGETASDDDNRSLAGLLTEQIEFADVVVINKIDKVDATRRDEITAVVKALNPVADIVYADHGQVPLSKILGTGLFDLERASAAPGWARELEGEHAPETEAYGIGSFVLRSTEPLHPWRFSSFMDHPFAGLIRAKGYVWVASQPEWVVSYSRAGNVATHEPVGRWWAAASRERWPSPRHATARGHRLALAGALGRPTQRSGVHWPGNGPRGHRTGVASRPPDCRRNPAGHAGLDEVARPVSDMGCHA
jgi:G3E family GTPase